MSEEEKKAKELIKKLIVGVEKYGYDFTVEESIVINKKEYKAIKVVLNELNKKDKIINLMAEHIEKGCDFDNRIQTKQQILEYFTNKVEEDKE